MSEAKEKNPVVLVEAIGILPSLIKTIASVVKSKKKDKAEGPKSDPSAAPTPGEAVVASIKDAVSGEISSTRLLNLGGSLIIIYIAWEDIAAHGLTTKNLVLIGIGGLYSIAMALVTFLKDRYAKA